MSDRSAIMILGQGAPSLHPYRTRRPFRVALLTFAAATLSAAAPAPSDALAREILHAADLLEAWDLQGARELVLGLMHEHPDEPSVLHIAGQVAFHEGDYPTAVDRLERAAIRYGQNDPMLSLARAAEKETRGYKSFESAHFSLRTPPGKDELLAPYALSALESARENLARDFEHEPPEKIVVEILEDAAGLSRVSSLTIAQIKASGTIALCKYSRLMITSPKALAHGYAWLDTLSHEFVHMVVSQKSRNTVPIWIHEGLAKFHENRWRGPPGGALTPFAEALLVQAIRPGGRLVTFAEMHPSMALLPTQEQASLAFAEVFTAVEWIYRRGGHPMLNRIVEELRGGATDRQAVSRAVGMSFEEFEREWKKALRERKPAVAAVVPKAPKLEFKEDMGKKGKTMNEDSGEYSDLPDRRATNFAHLGELLLARNRPAAAEQEYQKAIGIIGKFSPPRLVRRYARALMLQKKWAQAERALTENVALYDEEAASHILLGTIYLQNGQPDAARESFTLANRIDPFDPLIHKALHTLAVDRNDQAEAAREARALELLERPAGERMMARVGDAYLSIRARPVCKIFVDGEDTKLTTPIVKHPLKPGRHGVRLVNDELGVEKVLTVDLVAGDIRELDLDVTMRGAPRQEP